MKTAALLKHCQLYVGNDTGPMHLAAAIELPIIAISCHPFGAAPSRSYSPKRFAPWKVQHRVLQPPIALDVCASSGKSENGCHFVTIAFRIEPHCILGVTVEAVQNGYNRSI